MLVIFLFQLVLSLPLPLLCVVFHCHWPPNVIHESSLGRPIDILWFSWICSVVLGILSSLSIRHLTCDCTEYLRRIASSKIGQSSSD